MVKLNRTRRRHSTRTIGNGHAALKRARRSLNNEPPAATLDGKANGHIAPGPARRIRAENPQAGLPSLSFDPEGPFTSQDLRDELDTLAVMETYQDVVPEMVLEARRRFNDLVDTFLERQCEAASVESEDAAPTTMDDLAATAVRGALEVYRAAVAQSDLVDKTFELHSDSHAGMPRDFAHLGYGSDFCAIARHGVHAARRVLAELVLFINGRVTKAHEFHLLGRDDTPWKECSVQIGNTLVVVRPYLEASDDPGYDIGNVVVEVIDLADRVDLTLDTLQSRISA